jgi:hypothetical protein
MYNLPGYFSVHHGQYKYFDDKKKNLLKNAIHDVGYLIKIHKTDPLIRPIVNWKEAPAYKLAKMLTKRLGILIPLPYISNIKNSIQLVEDLLSILFDKDLKLISFVIENMYIPITELTNIEVMYKQNRLNTEIKYEIIKICNILTKQN